MIFGIVKLARFTMVRNVPKGPPPVPATVSGTTLRVPAGGLVGVPFYPLKGSPWKAYVEVVSGDPPMLAIMTPADYDSVKENWSTVLPNQYTAVTTGLGITRYSKGRVHVLDSHAPLPSGGYVLALMGGGEDAIVRVDHTSAH
jgi:hypothetical protein